MREPVVTKEEHEETKDPVGEIKEDDEGAKEGQASETGSKEEEAVPEAPKKKRKRRNTSDKKEKKRDRRCQGSRKGPQTPTQGRHQPVQSHPENPKRSLLSRQQREETGQKAKGSGPHPSLGRPPFSQDCYHHHLRLGGPDLQVTRRLIARAAQEDTQPIGHPNAGRGRLQNDPRGRRAQSIGREALIADSAAFDYNATQSQSKSEGQGQACGKTACPYESGSASTSSPSSCSSTRSRGRSCGPGALVGRGRSVPEAGSIGGDWKGREHRCHGDDLLHGPASVAGTIKGITIEDGVVHFLLEPTGTTSEALLRHQSGHPDSVVHCHRCTEACTGERVADDLVHALKGRLMKGRSEEEPWTRNLVKADPNEEDELRDLRARDARRLSGEGEATKPVKPAEPEKVAGSKKKDKKKCIFTPCNMYTLYLAHSRMSCHLDFAARGPKQELQLNGCFYRLSAVVL